MPESLSLRNKVLFLTSAALGSLALLAGCGDNDPEIIPHRPGTVIEHLYDDPDDWFMLVGKVPMAQHDDEHFFLDVRQCGRYDEEQSDANGVVSEVEVDENTYYDYPDGSSITFAR